MIKFNPVLSAVAAVSVAAAAIWVGWQLLHPSADPTTPDSNAEPFAWVDCKPRLLDGSPAVAVMFTQPLARSQDWGKLVKASEGEKPDTATPVPPRWVLGDNPRMLFLPNVTPDRTYRIALAEGMKAAGGSTLGGAHECTVKSEAMPEAFYFASKGVVLPAGQNGGLPVVTVNTPEVDVQFLRVNPDALPAFLEQVGGRPDARRADNNTGNEGEGEYEGGWVDPARKLKGTVGGYQLDELRGKATSVYASRFVTDTRTNRRNVSYLPVEKIKELQEPGIYVAVMNQPGRFGWDYQVTYFYVTDIGLHVRRHTGQLDVFTTSLKTGEAIKGAELTLIDDNGKSLGQTTSNDDGHAVLTAKLDKARAVVARRGKEMSVIALRDPALDLSEYDAGGHPSRNQKLFVYAGRDLYRPGEQFTVSVLARDADGKPLPAVNSAGVAVPAAGAAASVAGAATATPITLVLKKPDGESVSTQIVRPSAQGTAYYQHALSLPASAPTGRWLLEARLDPAAKRPDAAWSFQVEEFLPERMKLDLKAPDQVLTGGGELAIQVEGNYLYGAPAAGNTLQASATTERQRLALPQSWPGFIFGDVADDTARQRQDIGESTLDEAGKASISVPLQFAERSSPMKLRAVFSLLESGGRPVVRSVERSWWPADTLVGVRPLFERDVAQEGSLAGFELVRVNTAGKLVPAKGLQVRLVREDRQWYWRYDDQRGWHSGYNEAEELVDARSLDINARTTVSLPVTYGRYRLEVLDPTTQQTARYRFYAGWNAQDADDMGNRPDRVGMKLEGAPYKPGDKARITLTPPHDGEALVTVEGDRVLYQKRVKVRASGTTLDIPVDPAWNRHDLYVAAVVFRPGSEGDRITPARALGLAHLPLAREARQYKLAINAPAKTVPEKTVPVTVKLTDAKGQPLKGLAGQQTVVTLSAVDVGILNITRYATPNPSDFFFGKHRYDADLLDIYGKLIEKMDGNTARQRFGGDAGKRDTQSLPRKVRLVDLFSGPVALNDAGEATIPLNLPDFNGTLRLMAVASTPDSYASADAEMVVAAPLVAELAMPRFISPGDSATIALDVTNLSGEAQEVTVKVESGAPLRITGQHAPVKLANQQRTVLRYTAEATDAWGLAPIKLTVTAGKLKVVREAALQVQPATPLVREARQVRIAPDGTFKLDPTLTDAFWAGSASVNLTLSNKPPIDVRSAVQGLLMYPYGCLEQTTSSAYPLVFIDEAGATAYGMKPLSREERAKRLDVAFGRLSGMQQPQGGFGLWAASNPYEGWLSAYVTGFLQDAHDAGFAVPEPLLQRATQSLLEQLQKAPGLQTRPPKDVARNAEGRVADYRVVESLRMAHQRLAEAAHAGYILARAQKAPLATLRTLHDEWRGNARSPLAGVHLGLALKLMGDEARATVALDDALKLAYGINPSTGSQGWDEWLGDYGSALRDNALAYALLHRHQVAHPKRENLLLDLAATFEKRQYLSTQERLSLFLAARAAGGTSDAPWAASLQNGTTTATALSSKTAEQRSFDAAAIKRGVTVVNTGKDTLFAEVAAEGYALKPLAPRDDRIALERSWWTPDGKAITSRQFKTGDMVVVRLKVQAKQRIKDGMVVERVPAGMEVENLNLSQGVQASDFAVAGVNVAEAMADARIKHREFRDDRFVAAADLRDGPLHLFYVLRVVTPGKFTVPAPFAEDMYRPDVRGVGKAEADITVVDPRVK
jgi:uncharacterized protein YfaS (alpha-2-macroglobulin family)